MKLGLIDKDKPDNARRATFSKNKLVLIAANRIASNETMVWLLK
jgi:hypothetical protein